MTTQPASRLILIGGLTALMLCPAIQASEPWTRHTIDNTLKGADGVRLGDFDGDGLPDVVTGWEESGVVRLYLNPGADQVRDAWPRVTVGLGKSPEDAVPFDVDGDGKFEIISCHEGKQKQVFVHRFLPADVTRSALLEESNWKSSPVSKLDGQLWMFAAPVPFRNGRQGLVLGSKGPKASMTLLIPPDEENAQLNDWGIRKLRDSGWIMSIQTLDMDGDGDEDIAFGDRKSKHRGVGWLEQPDNEPNRKWKEHLVGAADVEPMFMEASPDRVLLATRHAHSIDFRRNADGQWTPMSLANPSDVPYGKAIRSLSSETLILTSNTHSDRAKTKQPAVWIKTNQSDWQVVDPTTECKFDRMELVDLDNDGDLDMMTCEERELLGVIWYENPGIQ